MCIPPRRHDGVPGQSAPSFCALAVVIVLYAFYNICPILFLCSHQRRRKDTLTGVYAFRASSSNGNMNTGNRAYMTSSPAATTSGQGNNPVSRATGLQVFAQVVCRTQAWAGFLVGCCGGLAPHHLRSLSHQPSNLSRSYQPSPILPAFPLSALSFISLPLLPCFLPRALWQPLFLTSPEPNYSRFAKIVAPRPRLFGEEMNSAPSFATRAASS